MMKMIQSACFMVILHLAMASTFGVAESINPNSAPAMFEALGLATPEERTLSAPLFDFSPFSANSQTVVPGFADPLGTGIDPGLRVFNGSVQFMDLLGNFNMEEPDRTEGFEMPRGTLRSDDLLSHLLSRYLAQGRAFDQSLLRIQDAEVTELDGMPVTNETSPLSLAGFGNVTDNQKPFFMHWTVCAAKEKRVESMEKARAKKKRACSAAGVCICSSI